MFNVFYLQIPLIFGLLCALYAAENGHVTTVQAFIDAGADRAIQNRDGKTAEYLARSNAVVNMIAIKNSGE